MINANKIDESQLKIEEPQLKIENSY